MESVLWQAIAAAIAFFFITLGGLFDEASKQDEPVELKEVVPEGYEVPRPELVEPDAGRNPPVTDAVLSPADGMENKGGLDHVQPVPGQRLEYSASLRAVHRV